MNLGTQYYRPPFPVSKRWQDDLKKMADSGLNTVQLWVVWAWVEAEEGVYKFDDYDELLSLASDNSLSVVLSTIAAIHPYWIHRSVPGSELVDNYGRKIISHNRAECHFGLTPGGCVDHPAVWEKMAAFISEVVKRYRNENHLVGWDIWNELRWNVGSEGHVCYCPETIKLFRKWLDQKYGGLDALNKAWNRRYSSWEDVEPGRLVNRPFTEMMAFQHFLSWKADQHGAKRYELAKKLDPDRPVTVHAAYPAPTLIVEEKECEHPVNRGNDWFLADATDGFGCSQFPNWGEPDIANYALNMETIESASQGKRVWISELQGGRCTNHFERLHSDADARSQQRWIWNGIAVRAETILFWCWRDEVFCGESGFFGLSGNDGFAEERLDAMRKTGKILDDNDDFFANFATDTPEVGVLFSPQTYYLHWSQEGNAFKAIDSLKAYTKALVRKSIPFRVIEEEHLQHLENLKILFLPRTSALSNKATETLTDFVKNGGTLVCECESGAWDDKGIFKYSDERFTALMGGVADIGRRDLPGNPAKDSAAEISASIGKQILKLRASQWVSPAPLAPKAELIAGTDSEALIQIIPVGEGKLVLTGLYLGNEYEKEWYKNFQDYIKTLILDSGTGSEVPVIKKKTPESKNSFIYIKSGKSKGKRVCFIFFPEDENKTEIIFPQGYWKNNEIKNIINEKEIIHSEQLSSGEISINVDGGEWGIAILTEK